MHAIILFICFCGSLAQKDPNFVEGRTTIVQLFEWKWTDIADECERFLSVKGYGAVQISPPNENLVISNRPWWERYQPVSYILNTRSGDERALIDMIRRCRDVGVNIYVDAVINHMSGYNGIGTAGSLADRDNRTYPAVPYQAMDFHTPVCIVSNYQDVEDVRNCYLEGLADLDQGSEYVRGKLVQYMNHLIDLGVAGFRIDAAKHMWPDDLDAIYSALKNLNINFGFEENTRPFIYQEVIDYGTEVVSKLEYTDLGRVLEFQSAASLGNVFTGGDKLTYLVNWGPGWNLLPSDDAVPFIDNHDTQRDPGTLTYKNSKPYKMATAFMLAYPYGVPRVMSSYAFDDTNQGPPQDSAGNLISPSINDDDTCGNGYICEHRWRQIYNMVEFRNIVEGTEIENWWSDGDQQIAFSRGDKGFVLFTNGGDVNQHLQTGLPAGAYCDIISGNKVDGSCTGKAVTVCPDGFANFYLGANEEDGVLAIHVNSKL